MADNLPGSVSREVPALSATARTAYYADKLDQLTRLFGQPVRLTDSAVEVAGRSYPVRDDVILTLPDNHLPAGLGASSREGEYAPEVQATFGDQWQRFSEVTDEHRAEFQQYFDLVDLQGLRESTVIDLGCGSGRYAACMAPWVKTLVVVDFSEAIFVARENLRDHDHAIFVMGDVLDLPFAGDAADLAYSLGVLHHLPVPALDATRRLLPLADRLLVYLYYALDNRPWYFRRILGVADALRLRLCRLRSPVLRAAAVWMITVVAYWPASRAGSLLPTRWRARVPLAEFYAGKSLRRLRQDAHDRFLTPVEQRVSREDIRSLADGTHSVSISEGLPYWHFLVVRRFR